ncbi:MAG TPA: phosphoadenylyl-sulfate reductase [Solirubrobacteraceae bacterium]|jgi:phosphoadenosine phosphosulfate reductase
MRSPRPDLEGAGAEEVLAYALAEWHPRLAVACSFQKEASVIVDMVKRIEPQARVFTLDTGVLFAETRETWAAMEARYGTPVEVYEGISLDEQARRHGDALWAREPDRCCDIRKVGPLEAALATVDAWVSGLRREQSRERAATPKLGWDERHGKWKLNPLADWTERDVWRYIVEHDLPYNALHDRGYASIGCTHCTRPGSGRDGRWSGAAKTECGLHVVAETAARS